MSITGRIDQPGDIDEFRFQAKTGQQLSVSVVSRELGHPLDSVVMLLGPDGKTLKEADDASRGNEDARLSYKVGADGEYRLRIFDRFGNGGFPFAYLLTVDFPVPKLETTVAADAYTLPADKPLEIEVKLNRQNGYSQEVEISAVNLPAGVTAKPVTSKKDGDSSKAVKLVLEKTGDIQRPGTFQIIAKPAGEGAKQVNAITTLSAFGARISNFWLSVPKSQLNDLPVEAKKP